MFITFVRWRLSVGIKRFTYLLTYIQTIEKASFYQLYSNIGIFSGGFSADKNLAVNWASGAG